jgi:hypothetical protein
LAWVFNMTIIEGDTDLSPPIAAIVASVASFTGPPALIVTATRGDRGRKFNSRPAFSFDAPRNRVAQ